MNCRKGYEVKLVDKQIVLTRDFARKAADALSKQYATLMQVCAAYPTFTVVKYTINQKVGREKYGKLDYKNMEALIKEWVSENTEAALEEFEKIKSYRNAIFWSFNRKNYQKTNWWSKTASANISGKLTIRTANTVRKVIGM